MLNETEDVIGVELDLDEFTTHFGIFVLACRNQYFEFNQTIRLNRLIDPFRRCPDCDGTMTALRGWNPDERWILRCPCGASRDVLY